MVVAQCSKNATRLSCWPTENLFAQRKMRVLASAITSELVQKKPRENEVEVPGCHFYSWQGNGGNGG